MSSSSSGGLEPGVAMPAAAIVTGQPSMFSALIFSATGTGAAVAVVAVREQHDQRERIAVPLGVLVR
jgi:hypothetical protein